MNSKEYFFDVVITEAMQGRNGVPIRVLELGCGTAKYVPAMIEKYASLEYVGIEPIQASYETATKILQNVPRTKISSQLGYDAISGLEDASFDVVISFSVLEHVKQLERFIQMGARYLKSGGIMVHRYDLGHALYPTSLKEHVHVWLGNYLPAVLPERTFVRYVPMSEVVGHYKQFLGSEPYKYTYHQMPNQKTLVKELDKQEISNQAMQDVYKWEFTYAADFAQLPLPVREKLFPAVAVWGRRV